jgi:hypothetical protein
MMKSMVARLFLAGGLAFGLSVSTGCMPMPGGGGGGGGNNNGNNNGNANGNGNGNGNANGNGNGNNNGGGFGPASLVLTTNEMHVGGNIKVGDDLIVYTQQVAKGERAVNYIIPSMGDDAVGIPGAENFDVDNFDVTGRLIILADVTSTDRAFGLTIFDVDSGEMTPIPIEDIRMANLPIGNYSAGFANVDGDFVATRNDAGSVTDGRTLKVIDLSGQTPVVISFAKNPGEFGAPSQVAVDEETRQVVAVSSDSFFVYGIDAPNAPPVSFDMTDFEGIGSEQIAFDGGMILYVDDSTEGDARVLDVSNAANTPDIIPNPNRTAALPMLVDDAFAFTFQAEASRGAAAAIGVLPELDATVGSGDTIFGELTCCGRFGFGDTIAIGRFGDDPVWFIGGSDDIGFTTPLQFSTGSSKWTPVDDPRSTDPDDDFPAADVHTNAAGTLLAFKYEDDNDDQFVGYALLP